MQAPIGLLLMLSLSGGLENRNPNSPPHLTAHMFLFGNGDVRKSDGVNPFENNALDGRRFLTEDMGFSIREIRYHRQRAVEYWLSKFAVNGTALEESGEASIIEYQINPDVNERAYLINEDCTTPAEGHQVLDGGFQLLITSPGGVEGFDPIAGERITFPFFTNLVFAWLRVKDCITDDDIVLPYRSSSLAEFTLNAIVFELEICEHPKNPFGVGHLLGTSAPIVNGSTITNRLLNYITFRS